MHTKEKSATLPRFVVVKSNHNNKYLRFVDEDEKQVPVPPGFLKFSGEEVGSHYAKFEVEMAKSSGNKGLVHIRSCYNNKYWVNQDNIYHDCWYIVAGADEPQEDRSKSSCTLFQPVYADVADHDFQDAKLVNSKLVHFRHVVLGHYVTISQSDAAGPARIGGIHVPFSLLKEKLQAWTVIDWESLVILPKHVAFKGANGNYISAHMSTGDPYLRVESADIGDPGVGNEVFTNPNGTLRIKSNSSGKFWRVAKDNWICVDADDSTTTNDNQTLFWPIKIDGNRIALRNMGNNNVCKLFTAGDNDTCGLSATVSTIDKEAYMEVEEIFLSRRISNVRLRLEHARIYNQKVVEMAIGGAVNRTGESFTVDVKLAYTKACSGTWNYPSMPSPLFKLGGTGQSSIHGDVPLIIDNGKIKIGFAGGVQFGEMEKVTSSQEKEAVYKVILPEMSRVKVRLLATEASCDVPISYTLCDTLASGEIIAKNLDDGVYTGVNTFDFKFEPTEEKL